MRILLIGKFPPIEGGVSAQTFWLARALARQGHEVNVVTNALEVEPALRQFHEDADAEWLTINRPGRLRVHHTKPVSCDSYIPFAPPYLSQLFGLSLEVIERYGCDVIISWYFEPYGLTAAMVAKTTGLPFFVRHAGSDLGRLSNHPNLHSSYRWMLNTATGLMVTNEQELEARFGTIETPRLEMLRPALPDVFSWESDPIDVDTILLKTTTWFQQVGLCTDVLKKVRVINRKPFPKDVFTIGVYGKVGPTKGNFDLLAALGQLARQGVDFVLLTMSCGRPATLQQYYEAILEDKEISRRTWILPPLAPWRVPSFLAQCQAATFLERGFSIAFHGPMVPFEILSSGSCLVCSSEVATKPFYKGNLVNSRNAIIIDDPRKREVLAETLLQVINNPMRSDSIGIQGRKLYQFFADDMYNHEDSAAKFLAQITEYSITE